MLGFNKSTSGRASDRLRLAMDQWKVQPAIQAPPAQRHRELPDQPPKRSVKLSWSPRSIKALLAITTVILVIIGFMWWRGSPTVHGGTSIPDTGLVLTEETGTVGDGLSEVVVHVAGDVKKPGLYSLPSGSRIADAIEAAGGVTKKSATDSVNLARELVDGEQITVGASTQQEGSGISINSSSATQLEELPGVGPVLAERIVSHRNSNGPFRSIDELGNVPGIGDSILGQIRTQATL